MLVCVVSDIHANLPALRSVLASVGPFDALWQLGDIVGYGPQPDEVVAALREADAGGVRGNHDAAALGAIDSRDFNRDARAAVRWTARQLGQAARTWLEALPERTMTGDFTLVHGSPRDPVWEYVHTGPVAQANLAAFETPHCLVGHTHTPLIFRQRRDGVETLQPTDGARLTLDERRTILNPGSVGQPRDGDPRASVMLLDTEQHVVEWRRVEYPIAETQDLMRDAGLPAWLIERLARGL